MAMKLTVAVILWVAPLTAEQRRPLELSDLELLVSLKTPDAVLVPKIESLGVAFTVTEGSLARLRELGASIAVLGALRRASERDDGKCTRSTDLQLWKLTKTDADPRLLQRYLKRCPDGMFADFARHRLMKVNPKDGLTYVWIGAGTFRMGCSDGDAECDADEKPAHEVTIAKEFWVGQTEVTQAAYLRVTGGNPSHFKGDSLPVDSVTWDEASRYCEEIGGRLPTDEEWEYAARGGTNTARYGKLEDIAWYGAIGESKSHETGQKAPNAWELYDTLGNVWEWVASWYEEGKSRSVRGGSSGDSTRFVRVSCRIGADPGRHSDVGFRCVGD
jgi:formylglycine-generating enzyme required for sulfatase activity